MPEEGEVESLRESPAQERWRVINERIRSLEEKLKEVEKWLNAADSAACKAHERIDDQGLRINSVEVKVHRDREQRDVLFDQMEKVVHDLQTDRRAIRDLQEWQQSHVKMTRERRNRPREPREALPEENSQ